MAGNPILARYEKDAEKQSGSLYGEGTSAYAQAGGAAQATMIQSAPGMPGGTGFAPGELPRPLRGG